MGKSTLVNALVGQKVAIVSPKAQTTRTRLMGIASPARRRYCCSTRPASSSPSPARPGDGRRRLGRTADADLIALVVDAKTGFFRRLERCSARSRHGANPRSWS